MNKKDYLNHRKTLIRGRENQRDIYMKSMLAISTFLLIMLLSFVTVEGIESFKIWLALSWLMFALCLFFMLTNILLSINIYNIALLKIDSEAQNKWHDKKIDIDCLDKKIGKIGDFISGLNVSAFIILMFGIFLTISVLSLNYIDIGKVAMIFQV